MSHPPSISNRLMGLRALMDNQRIDCLIVPRVDRYQGEYVTAADDRLAWLSAFTGSAGLALILKERAALFVDGRYTVQAKQQVSSQDYEVFQTPQGNPITYLQGHLKNLPKDTPFTLAYDPWLLTLNDLDKWQKLCTHAPDCVLNALESNPIDDLWVD